MMNENEFANNRIFYRIKVIQNKLQKEIKNTNKRFGSLIIKFNIIAEIARIAYDEEKTRIIINHFVKIVQLIHDELLITLEISNEKFYD